MFRINPGPFEPFIYFAQTRPFYRLPGGGGVSLFSLRAGRFAANWLDMSLPMCRRCRRYATWHCGGQAIIVSKLFAPRPPGVSDARMTLHLILTAAFLLYALFWLWHSIAL